MKRILTITGLGLLGLFVIAQLFRPELTNPPSDPSLSFRNYKGVPPEVLTKMELVCGDCHSNDTRWPWYSKITPVNYLLASDVNDGRRRMNFSEWGKYRPGKLSTLLDDIYDQVYHREMPLGKYVLMHPQAKLSDGDIKMICDWASREEDRLAQEAEMQSEKNEDQQATNDSARKKK